MPRFQVYGKGRDSGRARKRIYTAPDEISARKMADGDGTDINRIEELPPEAATERQIAYARDLEITIPRGVTKDELSDLISCRVDDDQSASSEILSLAHFYKVEATRYTGERAIYNRIFDSLSGPECEEKLATWFAFNVLRARTKARVAAGNIAPDNPRLAAIGSKLASDTKVMSSIKRYSESNLLWFGERSRKDGRIMEGGSNRTYAYKAALELIDAEFVESNSTAAPPKIRPSTRVEVMARTPRKPESKIGGMPVAPKIAAGILISLFVLMLIF